MHASDVDLAAEIKRFYADPLGFVMFAFPWNTDPEIQVVRLEGKYKERFPNAVYGPDVWACEFLDQLGAEVRKRNFNGADPVAPIQFATASGHGIGKSTLTAWIILWILSTRYLSVGTVTANTADQLRTKTWGELGKWHRKCVTRNWFTYSSGRGSMSLVSKERPDKWRCDAQTCREENSEAFAGQHSINSTSFYIFDEASAVPDKIYEVREGGLTDGEPMTFDFGNPTRNSGRFFEECVGRLAHRYIVRSIDSRTVKVTNKNLLAQWVEDYGEDSDFVKVRVRGIFPSVGVMQFMPSDSVRAAMDRPLHTEPSSPLVIGVDVARFGDDETVIYPRMGRDARSFEPLRLMGCDTVEVTGHVIETIKQFGSLGRPCAGLFVDGGGLGGGVVDQLKHLGYRPIEVQAQHRPIDPEHYRYRTDEMWGRMRDHIRDGLILPKFNTRLGTDMFAELTQRMYTFTTKGSITLESKKDMKERLPDAGSPNIADALALTYYQDVSPAMVGGSRAKPHRTRSTYNPLEADW